MTDRGDGHPRPVSDQHAEAVPLTPQTFGEVMPPECFAEVILQPCPEPDCDQLTMTVQPAAGARRRYVFHLAALTAD